MEENSNQKFKTRKTFTLVDSVPFLCRAVLIVLNDGGSVCGMIFL